GNFGTSPPGTGSLDVSAIEARVDPALVNINTTLAQGRAAGSGMLISSTGEVLTNNHVIADATSIKVVIGGTGPSHDAKVVGFAIPIDNAVGIVSQIRSGTDTDKVHIGDRALLGVQVQNVDGQNAAVKSGALVVGVQDNTGASAAGMQTGDVIVSLDGKPIAN